MKALLWKEMRETIWLWLGALLLAAVIGGLDLAVYVLNNGNADVHVGNLFLPCWVGLTFLAPTLLALRTLARENTGGLLLLGSLPLTSGQLLAGKRLAALVALVSLLGLSFLIYPAELAITHQAVAPAVAKLAHGLNLEDVETCMVVGTVLLAGGLALSALVRSGLAAAFGTLLLTGAVMTGYLWTQVNSLLPRFEPWLGVLRPGARDWAHALAVLGVTVPAVLISTGAFAGTPILASRLRLKRSGVLFGKIVLGEALLLTLGLLSLPYPARPAGVDEVRLDPTGQWLALRGGEDPSASLDPCGVWMMKTDGSHLALLSRGPASARYVASDRLFLIWGRTDEVGAGPLTPRLADRSGDRWRLRWRPPDSGELRRGPPGVLSETRLASGAMAVTRDGHVIRELPANYFLCGSSADQTTLYLDATKTTGGEGQRGQGGNPPRRTHAWLQAMNIATGAMREIGQFEGEDDFIFGITPGGRWLTLVRVERETAPPKFDGYVLPTRAVSLTLIDPGTGAQHVFPGLAGGAVTSRDERYLWCSSAEQEPRVAHILDLQSAQEVRTLPLPAPARFGRTYWRMWPSPCGDQVAIVVYGGPGRDRRCAYLYVARGDGTGLRPLGELSSPGRRWFRDDEVEGWTWDGDLLLFNREAGTVARLNVQSGARRQLYPPQGSGS